MIPDREELNEFFRILLDKCKHEWAKDYTANCTILRCMKCYESTDNRFLQWSVYSGKRMNYDIVDFMEKEMPEVWKGYFVYTSDLAMNMGCIDDASWFNLILDPQNLFKFLNENREPWGLVECPDKRPIELGIWAGCHNKKNTCACKEGNFKHPAFEWLEERNKEKEENK